MKIISWKINNRKRQIKIGNYRKKLMKNQNKKPIMMIIKIMKKMKSKY